MPEIEVISESPITITELKEKLNDIKKKQDLSFRGNKTLDYLNHFAKISPKDAEASKEKMKGIGISRLKDRHIAKIIDIMPEDIETLKTILANENITLKDEELKKILECLK